MSERTARRHPINEPDGSNPDGPQVTASSSPEEIATVRTINPDAVQQSINRLAEVGADNPTVTQMGPSEVAKAVDRDPAFEEQYAKSTSRGAGFLHSKRAEDGGRSRLVPPNATQHPTLPGRPWCLYYMGKYLVLYWVPKYSDYQQLKYEQGYTYFEGPLWTRRLGLNPENYLNEKGRIQIGDVELAWIGEEFVRQYGDRLSSANRDMVDTARDKLMSGTNAAMPGVHVFDGPDAEAMLGEFKERSVRG